MAWNDNLVGPALDIASNTARIIRVIAGPGTGKTFAMKRRIAKLLEDGIEPAKILAVTFTRVASSNLIKELTDIGIEGSENIRASTLHSFCFSVLMKSEIFTHIDRTPRPLISFDKAGVAQFEVAPLLIDLQKKSQYGDKRKKTKRIKAFEAAWARLQSEEPGWPRTQIDSRFQNDLFDWLKFHQCILIGELVPLTLQYFRSNPTATELQEYDHVVVDEYQDLNKAEQALLELLAQNGSLFIVGDHNQSIYSFRYAHPDGIIEFIDRHTDTYDGILRECRRCPVKVINIANSLIQNNNVDIENYQLIPLDGAEDGNIYIIQWDSLNEEIKELSDYIEYLLNEGDYEPGDIIVLSPRRLIGYSIRDNLREKEIPVHSFYHEELLESEEAQESYSYLNLLVNNHDRVSLRFLLGNESPTFLYNQYLMIRNYCEESGENPREVLDKVLDGELTIDGVRNEIKNKYRDIREKLNELNDLDIEDLIEELFPDGERWTNSIRDALNVKTDELNDDEELEAQDVSNIIKNTVTQPEMPESGEFVRVMSIHKSKGLTSKVVIIAGCMEGIIPTYERGLSQREKKKRIEEQRRLFYVALTRAKEIIVISSSRGIKRDISHRIGAITRPGGSGPYARAIASRFLSELGPESPQPIRGINWRDNNYS